MLTAILIMALLAVILGAALGYASVKFRVEGNPLVDKIEAILPQTQCGQCGYPGCKPYAEAIASGEAEINLCPPGGIEGVRKLADLLGREVKPLDAEEKPKQRAVIDENSCIGCTLCIQACPTDAILGAHKRMHTVIEAHCTGCALCVAPCPVDCITLHYPEPTATGWAAWSPAQAQTARQRYSARQQRLASQAQDAPAPAPAPQDKQATIAHILARARKNTVSPGGTHSVTS